ncbi:hypothetical protein [Aestuariivirga sp.]|uniref:hypothetical protein n=1 Tax=Aestuariivirga sp. TaxID=2650926 RepID=UPI0039E2B9A8
MTNTPPPPGDPAWAEIRARYEAGAEKVEAIAAGIGLTRIALSMRAMKEGWTMRGKGRSKAKPATTRETIHRLKEMLQKRLAHLEEEVRNLGKEVSGIEAERGIKSVNTLVRTLEKVIDLERKDKLKRRQIREQHKSFDDEQRRQLAAKIDRLEAERDGGVAGAGAEPRGGPGTEQPVALLGEAGPAASAGGT